jgi:hypothetical protein
VIEPVPLFFGSSGISGKGCPDPQEEVFIVPESVGHPFDHLDLVVDPFEQTGAEGPAAVSQYTIDPLFQVSGEPLERLDAASDRPSVPLFPESPSRSRMPIVPQML